MIRKSRKKALDYYQKGADGKYVYTGGYMVWEKGGKARKATLGKLWALTVGAFGCAVAAGCIPAPGLADSIYVIVPLVIQIILAGACIWSLWQFSDEGEQIKEYIFHDSVEKLPGRLTGALVFALLTAVLEGLYLILNPGFASMILLFWVLEILSAGAAIWAKKIISRLEWTK